MFMSLECNNNKYYLVHNYIGFVYKAIFGTHIMSNIVIFRIKNIDYLYDIKMDTIIDTYLASTFSIWSCMADCKRCMVTRLCLYL